MRNQYKSPSFSSLVFVAIDALAALLVSTLLKDWLIVGFGIRFYKNALAFTLIIAIGSIIIAIIRNIPFLRWKFSQLRDQRAQRQAQQEQAEAQAQQSQDPNSPASIHALLLHLRQEMPQHVSLIDGFLGQMQRMDDIQARQHRLITENAAIYLQNIEEVLDNAERHLCNNLRKFTNLCIATEHLKNSDIDQIYIDNETILDKCAKLIEVSANYINNYNSGQSPSYDEVDLWRAQLEESLREDPTLPSPF